MTIFLICGQLMRHLLIKLFHFSNLLPMPDDQRMVHVEFFDNFSYSCKRINFDDPLNWSLSASNGRPLHSFIFKALICSAKLLESPLQSMFVSSS